MEDVDGSLENVRAILEFASEFNLFGIVNERVIKLLFNISEVRPQRLSHATFNRVWSAKNAALRLQTTKEDASKLTDRM